MSGSIAPQIFHDPARLGFVVGKPDSLDWKRRVMRGVLRLPVGENRLVQRYQLSGDVHDRRWTAPVVPEVNDAIGADAEVLLEAPEDLWIGASPRVNRLLVVADGEDVTVLLRQSTNDRVLNGIQILELVDKHNIPPRAYFNSYVVHSEQLRRLQHQSVEIGDVSFRHRLLISLVILGVADAKRVSPKPVS